MNYVRVYDELIDRARNRGAVDGYSERHHIVMVKHGGPDDPSNLVDLTAREHFIAHWLLKRIHNDAPAVAAFRLMADLGDKKGIRVTSYAFAEAREAFSKSRKGVAIRGTGWSHSEETRAKMSGSANGFTKEAQRRGSAAARAARIKNGNYGHSEESRKAISEGRKGKGLGPRPAELMERIHAKQRGVPRPHMQGRKQPEATCPHCGKVGGAYTMPRWHFDNCRHKAA